MTQEQDQWKEESDQKIEELLNTFNGIDHGNKELSEIDKMLKTDKQLKSMAEQ